MITLSLEELKAHSLEIAAEALEQAAIIADNNNAKDVAHKIRVYKSKMLKA